MYNMYIYLTIFCSYVYITIDREISVIKNCSSTTFSNENEHAKCVIYIDLHQFLVAKVWRWNLDYTKNLQSETGENIAIYGMLYNTLQEHALVQ